MFRATTKLGKNMKHLEEKERTIKIGEEQVHLSPKRLIFNEANLGQFLEEEAVWYDYFGQKLCDAELLLQGYDLKLDALYAEKFAMYKDAGCSDKLADAKALASHDVYEANESVISAKYKVRLLYQHLKAWDKAHENAQNRANTLRRELAKLHGELRLDRVEDKTLEEKIDGIIGKSE
jgi:hypothetical protein